MSCKKIRMCEYFCCVLQVIYFKGMLLIGSDSNNGESTQMLLKKTQIKTCCHIILQRGEGNLGAFQHI